MRPAQPAVRAARHAVRVAAAECSGRMRTRLGLAAGGAIPAGGPDRHGDAKVRTGELTVDDLHRAAVSRDELQHHRKSDAGSLDGARSRRAPGVEGLEDMLAF